jgi:hypothetical protein
MRFGKFEDLMIGSGRSTHVLGNVVFAASATLPHYFSSDHLALCCEPHLVDNASQQLLLGLHIEVAAEPAHAELAEHFTHLLRCADRRYLSLSAPVLISGGCYVGETRIPRSLQRLRHQSICWIHQLIPALCELALVFETLQLELPLPINPGLFLTLPLVIGHGEINGTRVNYSQHQILDERIDAFGAGPSTDRLTEAPVRVVA